MENTNINEEKVGARSKFNERLKAKHPNKSYDDDEQLFAQIGEDYDDYENRMKGYEENEKDLTNMFSRDPKSAQFLASWHNGEDPVVYLIKTYGKDNIMNAINDDKRLEELSKANQEYVDRVSKEKDLDTQYETNLAESLKEIDKIQEERGLDDEAVNEAMQWLIGVVGDAVMGKFSPETIEMALKAINHDNDVEEASSEGEIRGRNAKIEERLRKRGQGDGIANLTGKNGLEAQPKKNRSIFDIAAGAM